jgi:hypothetical protein
MCFRKSEKETVHPSHVDQDHIYGDDDGKTRKKMTKKDLEDVSTFD